MNRFLGLGLVLIHITSWSQNFEELCKQRVEYQETPGIAAVIFENGQRQFISYGLSNVESQDEVTPKTLFEIGSITKTFTSSMLSYFVKKNELDLNDPVQKHLPSSILLPQKNGKSITLLHLATQHAGLPRMPGNFSPADQANPYIDYTEKELTAYLNNCELKYEPGTTYEYSNLGMGTLGYLLTQKKNKPYSELVKETLLSPLQMNQTFISGQEKSKYLAVGYKESNPAKAWTWSNESALTGAGGIVSNTEDMVKFLIAQLGSDKSILSLAFEDAHRERMEAGSENMQIGLAWHIRDHKYVWHNGGTGGFRSFIGFDPIKKRGLVILTNSSTGIDDLGFHWLDESFPLKEIKKPLKLATAMIKEYEGIYQINPTFTIAITSKGTNLFMHATAQPTVSIYAEEVDKFFLKAADVEIHFMRGVNNRIEKLVLLQNGGEQEGKKIN